MNKPAIAYTYKVITVYHYCAKYFIYVTYLFIFKNLCISLFLAALVFMTMLGLSLKMAPHSSTLAWKIPWTEEPVGYSPWSHKELDTTERLHFHFTLGFLYLLCAGF